MRLRKEGLTWGSIAQGFLGMRRMTDRLWGSMALS